MPTPVWLSFANLSVDSLVGFVSVRMRAVDRGTGIIHGTVIVTASVAREFDITRNHDYEQRYCQRFPGPCLDLDKIQHDHFFRFLLVKTFRYAYKLVLYQSYKVLGVPGTT